MIAGQIAGQSPAPVNSTPQAPRLPRSHPQMTRSPDYSAAVGRRRHDHCGLGRSSIGKVIGDREDAVDQRGKPAGTDWPRPLTPAVSLRPGGGCARVREGAFRRVLWARPPRRSGLWVCGRRAGLLSERRAGVGERCPRPWLVRVGPLSEWSCRGYPFRQACPGDLDRIPAAIRSARLCSDAVRAWPFRCDIAGWG